MTFVKYLLSGLCGFIAAIILMLAGPRVWDSLRHFDRQLQTGFFQIHYGDKMPRIQMLMRGPGVETNEFRLGQLGGYEFEYAAAEKSGAKYYVMWNNLDHVYTIGFDDDGKAIFKAEGGT